MHVHYTLDATMQYSGAPYTFSTDHGAHMHYPQHIAPPQNIEGYFTGHAHGDLTDFGHHTAVMEEFEDGGETSTRPRLTKDQVDVLESQFQAQPKPNSNIKRQLAVQTKLTLPRVAVSLDVPSSKSQD